MYIIPKQSCSEFHDDAHVKEDTISAILDFCENGKTFFFFEFLTKTFWKYQIMAISPVIGFVTVINPIIMVGNVIYCAVMYSNVIPWIISICDYVNSV